MERESLADYLAARVLADYGPAPLSRATLFLICEHRQVRVYQDRKITSPALYLPEFRLIVHRPAAPPWLIAHELLHVLLADVEPGILPNFAPLLEEPACNAFATRLCGKSPFLPRQNGSNGHVAPAKVEPVLPPAAKGPLVPIAVPMAAEDFELAVPTHHVEPKESLRRIAEQLRAFRGEGQADA